MSRGDEMGQRSPLVTLAATAVGLVGLLVALATLLLTIGGVRYLLAGGDPGEVQRAKNTLKSAAVGYGVAALSPLLVRFACRYGIPSRC